MSRILLAYISRDGQTRKIAHALQSEIELAGPAVELIDLQLGMPMHDQLEQADLVIILAAIRYGRHLKESDQFLHAFRSILTERKLVMLSVNLTARKEHKRSIEHSVYLQKWLKRYPFEPQIIAAIAGKLDYPRYGRFDRFMIQLIMTMTKGPTDPSLTVEYTDWDQVKALAKEIVSHV